MEAFATVFFYSVLLGFGGVMLTFWIKEIYSYYCKWVRYGRPNIFTFIYKEFIND